MGLSNFNDDVFFLRTLVNYGCADGFLVFTEEPPKNEADQQDGHDQRDNLWNTHIFSS